MKSRLPLPFGLLFILFSACSTPPDVSNGTLAHLSPGDMTAGQTLKWSPKAEAVPLEREGELLKGAFSLGSPGTGEFNVELTRSAASSYFDQLWIDTDRDGERQSEELLSTEPNEVRYKMWSSFKTVLQVEVQDPETGERVLNPYPVSLWYVEDLREPQTEHALRFTRQGWMQGQVELDGVLAHIRVSESTIDGLFTIEDEWTLALPDSVHQLYSFQQDRDAKRHAWLGEKAYRLININPTGRTVRLEPIDPGVTRAQELLDDDQLAVDRQAPHSGRVVDFKTDFDAAERDARNANKTLFIDFETVWCGPCKTMEEWVYTADAVVEAAENMISVKVDGDDFPELAKRFEVAGYPTMVKLAPSGEITGKVVGYQGVEAMAAFLAQ
ncbi:thioredoxin family protein [bacterium]|nr:thioredoxin family protein [bacterium]